jgi:hypothetical protein
MLAEEENSAGLARINRELIGKVEAFDSAQRVVLDMDSTEIPVYGDENDGRRKECTSQDQRMAAGCMLTVIGHGSSDAFLFSRRSPQETGCRRERTRSAVVPARGSLLPQEASNMCIGRCISDVPTTRIASPSAPPGTRDS